MGWKPPPKDFWKRSNAGRRRKRWSIRRYNLEIKYKVMLCEVNIRVIRGQGGSNFLLFPLCTMSTTSAPIAQSGEHWIAELTGSESPVWAASALAVCSWLGLPAIGGSGLKASWRQSRGAGRVRLCGHVKLSSLNPAGYLEFTDRTVEVRTCATSSA